MSGGPPDPPMSWHKKTLPAAILLYHGAEDLGPVGHFLVVASRRVPHAPCSGRSRGVSSRNPRLPERSIGNKKQLLGRPERTVRRENCRASNVLAAEARRTALQSDKMAPSHRRQATMSPSLAKDDKQAGARRESSLIGSL